MKRISKLTILFLLSFISLSNASDNKISAKTEKKILELIITLLEKTHYSPINIDNKFSKKMYKEYLYSLDKQKVYFLQSDIDEFSAYELKIDDQIKKNDLTFFYLTYDRVIKRMKESKEIYTDILRGRIDVMTNELINTDFEDCKYSNDKTGIAKKWLNQFKASMLGEILEIEKKDNTKAKSFEETEREARENALAFLNGKLDNYQNVNRVYFFNIFINSIINQFDNHSEYIPAFFKGKFDVAMSGKIIGIGVKFIYNNGFIAIEQLAYGGPAWKSKKIDAGDLILKIQEENKEIIDVVGYTQEDLLKLVRGKAETILKVTVKKEDGTIKEVSMKRAVIEIEDSYVKSSVAIKNGKKYGVINIPIFYKDFEDENARDAAKDVEKEIENLKKDNVEGIVIDLRNNGGGSLDMSLQIAGYFLGNTPIIQVKNSEKSINILSDLNAKIIWDKPLVLLVNNDSASATEVFAAAIQDYKRGIIIGSAQTFGKGTTQNTVDLNGYNIKKDEDDFGILQTTIQKYYRVNGGSTQLTGVQSDIVVRDRFWNKNYGEKSRDNILIWDKIDAIPFKTFDNITNSSKVINDSKIRIESDKNFNLLAEFQDVKLKTENKTVLINLDKYREKIKIHRANQEAILNLLDYSKLSNFKSTTSESLLFKKLPTLEEKRKQWNQALSKDFYVNEALNVLSEIRTN